METGVTVEGFVHNDLRTAEEGKSISLLYLTDPWQTKASRILHGAFETEELAREAALSNNLGDAFSLVVIETLSIGSYGAL